jgi:uncharacterized membrane protein YgcG
MAGFSLILLNEKVYALYWTLPNYDIDIKIEENTKFSVTESATHVFSGELNGLRRDITLEDQQRNLNCAGSLYLTCGGFEFLIFKELYVDGVKQSKGDFELYTIDDGTLRSFRIEKRLHDPAEFVTNEAYKWEYTYDVYGGIRWANNANGQEVPYFYWNMVPEGRGGPVDNSEITIQFPENVDFDINKLYSEIDGYFQRQFEYTFDESTNTITIFLEDLPSYGDVTFWYEFDSDELIRPGTLEYSAINPKLGINVLFNGIKADATQDTVFEFLPTGEYDIEFQRFGYEPHKIDVDIRSDEITTVDIDLNPYLWMSGIIATYKISFVVGIILAAVSPYLAYRIWKKRGRDKNPANTIIPLFKPPKGVRPYLLGSLKDEQVDKRDLSGTIIDLAYRGFIKIKEIKKNKDYELKKLDGNEGDSLDEVEQDIMDAIFKSGDETTTKKLRSVTFAQDIHKIVQKIYSKMKTDGYFDANPDTTRNMYVGLGIGTVVLGIVLAVGGSFGLTELIGLISLFTPGIGLFLLGVGIIVIARHMPAKTEQGSKVLGEIKGFKMYLEAAERFRLQNLEPEDFEKYLSYAVVFEVEKQWAKSFKDIYHGTPEWYEGSSDITDAIFWSSFGRNFASAAEGSFTVSQSSGMGSGSGWSGGGVSGGGGSFGGFSGGGGGGGSSGGW